MISALFLLASLCVAQVIIPDPGEIVQLVPVQDDESGCLIADNNADGSAVYLAQCDLDLDNRSWNATVGANKNGPLTIFGNKCLDVTNGVDADGTKLQVWTCGSGNPNQQFSIDSSDGTIRWAKNTNKCIDLTGGSITDGTPVQIWTCGSGNKNQQWSATPRGNAFSVAAGGWIIFGKPIPAIHEDGCLTASNDTNGAPLTFQNCNGISRGPNPQNWTLTAGSVGSGIGPATQIKISGGTKCIDMTNGNTADGTKLQVWDCVEGNTNQLWTVNGDLTIRLVGSNPPKCLDLTNGDLSSGTPIQIWECGKFNPNQMWPALEGSI